MVGVWEIQFLAPLEPLLNRGGILIPEPLAVVLVAKIEPPTEVVVFLLGVIGILPLSILTFKFKLESDFKLKFLPASPLLKLSLDTTLTSSALGKGSLAMVERI